MGRTAQFLAEVAVGWAVAVPCALGSRLLLSMREAFFTKKREETVLSDDAVLWQGDIELDHGRSVRRTDGLSFVTLQ